MIPPYLMFLSCTVREKSIATCKYIRTHLGNRTAIFYLTNPRLSLGSQNSVLPIMYIVVSFKITSADNNITIIIDNTYFPLNGASY